MSNKKQEIKPKITVSAPAELGPDYFPMHQAAKMTGYHQDYLGQLARGGKLDAVKVGRNWFTTKFAIDKMLGRIPGPAPVTSERVTIRDAVTEAVLDPEVEVTQVEEVKQAVESVRVPTQFKQPRILVKQMVVSIDAGPNLQEMLASVAFRREPLSKNIGAENRDVFYRWKKISGNNSEFTTKLTVDKLRKDLSALNNELMEIKNSFSAQRADSEVSVQKNSKLFAPVVTSFAAIILMVSASVFLYDYFSSPQVQPVVNEITDNKMVAGESTSVDPEELHWPPPYLYIRE